MLKNIFKQPFFELFGYHFLYFGNQIKNIIYLCNQLNQFNMIVVNTRDFRANQTKFLNMAKSGEHVVLKSRAGNFRIFPEDSESGIEAPRDLMQELKNALIEAKEAIEGKRVLKSAESLLNEL